MIAVAAQKLKVLVADDEAIIAMNLRMVLREMGFEVPGIAQTATEAIALAHKHRPHLILMDINLKGPSDGIFAAEEIRKNLKIPVVFLTAYSDSENQKRAALAEPLGYISKPVTDADLKQAVQEAIGRITHV